jgi:hypothetical protein
MHGGFLHWVDDPESASAVGSLARDVCYLLSTGHLLRVPCGNSLRAESGPVGVSSWAIANILIRNQEVSIPEYIVVHFMSLREIQAPAALNHFFALAGESSGWSVTGRTVVTRVNILYTVRFNGSRKIITSGTGWIGCCNPGSADLSRKGTFVHITSCTCCSFDFHLDCAARSGRLLFSNDLLVP